MHLACLAESALLPAWAMCYLPARSVESDSITSSLGRPITEEYRMRKEALTMVVSSLGAIAWITIVPMRSGAG